MSGPVIGYAGMTHLGLVSASAAAAPGFRTVAFDADAALVGRLKPDALPISEPGLPELIAQHNRDLVIYRRRWRAWQMRCRLCRRRCSD